MALKLDPVDLMIYADVAEAFENWLINNPNTPNDPQPLIQSRVFAKSYLNLYVTFLQMFKYVPKEEMKYETVGEDGVKRQFDAIEEVYIDSEENIKLHAWLYKNPDAKYTAIFFHGNSGNITERSWQLNIFKELGIQALKFDYRGFGSSDGQINSMEEVYHDSEAVLKFLSTNYNIPYETKLIEDADVYAEMVNKSNQPMSPCVEIDGEMLTDVGGSEVEEWLQQHGHWQGAME